MKFTKYLYVIVIIILFICTTNIAAKKNESVKHSGKFTSVTKKVSFKTEIYGVGGEIKSSLWESMSAQGIPTGLILEFANIFAWQIDFLTEPRKGDSYQLVWEHQIDASGKTQKNVVIAAQYNGQETSLNTALRFKNNFYDANGNALRKMFLHAPLNYRRISSYFSYKRFHPVLRYWRPHLGIDYSAPTGTPVVSVGDGTISFVGRRGQYGKTIIIRHNSVYTSMYGHLNGYARGIKSGKHINQGDVIGYVGSTGLATGPHLDFRIKKYTKFVNFLKLKFPSAARVLKKDMNEFSVLKKKLLYYISTASTHKTIHKIE